MEITQLIQQINNKDNDRNLGYSLLTSERELKTISNEEMILNMSVSSERAIEDFFGYLILDHKPESILLERFKDGASFRDKHQGDQIGIITNPKIDEVNKKLRIDVKFSPNNERAIMLYKDYRDGYRKNVSIRFLVHKMVLEKEVDGIKYFRATKWEPVHVSAEPDGADPSVGMNRNLSNNNYQIKHEAKMEDVKITTEQLQEIANKVKSLVSDEYKAQVDRAVNESNAKELDRVGAILSLGKEFKNQVKGVDLEKEAEKFAFKLKASDRDFSDFITKNIISQQSTNDGKLGLSEKEQKKYSFRNLILSQVPNSGVKADFELEVSRAYVDKYGYKAQGIVVPPDILLRDRSLLTSSVSAGGAMVADNLLPQNFIELARNKTISDKVGVTYIGGLVGDAVIPKQSGAGTFSWMANEYTGASASDATFAQLTLTPKLGTSNTAYSRKLLFQSTPAIDALIENDLAQITAIGKDLAVFHGTGASGQPTGIAATSGIGGGALSAALTFADVVDLETDVANANRDAEKMFYVTNPTVRGLMKTREKVSGYPQYICDNNMVNGYPLISSKQISSGYLFFGDFSQVILAEWNGLDIVVDPYSQATNGLIKVTVFIYIDVGVRDAGAFAVATNVS